MVLYTQTPYSFHKRPYPEPHEASVPPPVYRTLNAVTKNVFLRQQTVVAVGRKIISTNGSVEIHRLNSLQHSPASLANSYFLGHILWNPKVQYSTPNSLALLPLLSHTIRYYFFKTHFNIILPATHTYSSGPFSSCFPNKALWHFSSPLYVPQAPPVSSSSSYLSKISRISSLRSLFHPPVASY